MKINTKHFTYLFFIINALTVISCKKSSEEGWELIEYNYRKSQLNYDWANINSDIYSIHFISKDTVFISGYNHALYGNGSSFGSVDGGETWQNIYNNFEGRPIIHFSFFNGLKGYSASGEVGSEKLLKMENGFQGYDTFETFWSGDYFGSLSFTFVNDTLGYQGDRRTTDGGVTWELMSEGPPTYYNINYFFLDNLNGYRGNGTDLESTSDAGYSWNLLYSGSEDILKCEFLNASFGLMKTENTLLKSEDGGVNWTPIAFNIRDFYFVNTEIGFFVSNSSIYKTKNGGESWKKIYGNDQFHFLAIDGWGNTVMAGGKQIINPGGGPAFVVRSTTLGE